MFYFIYTFYFYLFYFILFTLFFITLNTNQNNCRVSSKLCSSGFHEWLPNSVQAAGALSFVGGEVA